MPLQGVLNTCALDKEAAPDVALQPVDLSSMSDIKKKKHRPENIEPHLASEAARARSNLILSPALLR